MSLVAPGTRVGAFRVERPIASGSTGAVYEATQPSLGRTVALRLIQAGHFADGEELARFDAEQRLAASVHHPNVVPTYESGEWDGGRYVATRFVRGRTLAELFERGEAPPSGSLDPLAGALAAIHAAGLAHGAVAARNVIVDDGGAPHLADLGLGRPGTPAQDDRALAAVRARLPSGPAPDRGGRRRAVAAAAAVLAVLAAGAVALALGGDDEPERAEALGCHEPPSPNTPACTVAQTRLDGGAVRVERAGVLRSWTVEGASGLLSLQVIRARSGESFSVGFTQPEQLEGAGSGTFPAELAVRPGDTIGVRLEPGATIGRRTAPAGSEVVRWDGGLTGTPQGVDETVARAELALRFELEPGARVEGPRLLTGAAAASAPPGRSLAAESGTHGGRIEVVELPSGIAVDLVGPRRLARLEVPDADPDGELVELAQNCGPVGGRGLCLRWQNPGDELPLVHAYLVRPDGSIELVG